MAELQAPTKEHLDPAVLAKIASLELRARMVVEGFITGLHASPYQGYSVEFAQHRPYVPGDEIKHVDWKVFARTDKFYLKQYQEETNLTAQIVLDASESMSFGSRAGASEWNKFEYARSAAASLGYLALQQQDSVGLTIFSSGVDQNLRPSNSPVHWRALLAAMDRSSDGAKTEIGAVLEEVAERMPRRGLVILISVSYSLIAGPIQPDEAGYSLTSVTMPANSLSGKASRRMVAVIPTSIIEILPSLIRAFTCICEGSGRRKITWRSRIVVPSSITTSPLPRCPSRCA